MCAIIHYAISKISVALLILSAMATATVAETMSGHPVLTDGDTFEIDGQSIRLFGIDAPEMAQRCAGSRDHRHCGDVARRALTSVIRGLPVRCTAEGADLYDRMIATCWVGDTDLGRWMVANGWAMAFRTYSVRYVSDEGVARVDRRGFWRGHWQPPWEFRAQRWQAAVPAAPNGCPIKGNINRRGERIYHTPWGSRWYGRTVIRTRDGERWFCSEREARDAGWRAPLR